MKKIAALTMVRNDDFFLRKWVEYYGGQLGRENLYVFFDGKDQVVQPWCEGVNVTLCEKIPGKVVELDRIRIAFLSDEAAKLFDAGYDIVIGTDADEFIVVDPKLGQSLAEFLSAHPIKGSLSPLGLDFGQRLGQEGNISEDATFLSQRHYAQLGTRYTKTSILAKPEGASGSSGALATVSGDSSAKPLRWGSGFHRVKGHNFHIAKDLYLLHFGYFDLKRIEDRFKDQSRITSGWEKHIRKRSRTIRLVSTLKARDFDKTVKFARICQSIVRPPYAWNKPAMFELKLIVRIPDRFQNLV